MSTHERRNWIAVASADHVALGRAGGYMQVGHGKRAPLARLRAADRIVYYSPARQLGAREPLQAFTAVGVVREGEPYAFDMGHGFVPFRRDVDFAAAQPAAIRPLLDTLGFAQPREHWGAKFRYGLFCIDEADLRVIVQAMQADVQALGLAG